MPGSAENRESRNGPERGHEQTDKSRDGPSATRVLAQRIILSDVILPCHIGATAKERAHPQQIRKEAALGQDFVAGFRGCARNRRRSGGEFHRGTGEDQSAHAGWLVR